METASGPRFQEILDAIRLAAPAAPSLQRLQEETVQTIAARLPHYNWVGFYMLDPEDPQMLVLGPFVGAPTPHVRIPVHEGICGAAVAQQSTIVVDDVNADPRYLACSLETRSEIVVPIFVGGKPIGEIDIDSHEAAAFTPADRAFLEEAAEIVADYMRRGQK